jgi:hypothetical protein
VPGFRCGQGKQGQETFRIEASGRAGQCKVGIGGAAGQKEGAEMTHFLAIAYGNLEPMRIVLAGSQGIAMKTIAEDCNLDDAATALLLEANTGQIITVWPNENNSVPYRIFVTPCDCTNPGSHVSAHLNQKHAQA